MKILTVGNIIPRKRFDLCARACARLEEDGRYSDLVWRVVGRGPELEKIKLIAPQSMEFIDRVEILRDQYQWADLFVLPSYDEGFGMVYIEAIMCGCPIVCTRGEGGTEIAEDTGGGICIDVPADDNRAVENILAAIHEIACDPARFMNDKVIATAVDKVSPKRVATEWRKLIAECQAEVGL